MEVIIAVALVFLIGYAVGKRAARPAARPVRREYTRDREYGGFGALGATHDSSDFGDGGS